MELATDRAVLRQTIARDPTFHGLDLTDALAAVDAAETHDAFLLAAMRVMARGGNGHSRVIPNDGIRVWPVRFVSQGPGVSLAHPDGRLEPVLTVNGVPPEVWLDRFRPLLAGTPARQSVIGAMLLAWPAALGCHKVTYEFETRALRFGPDTLVPASGLYPSSESGAADHTDVPVNAVHWEGSYWYSRIARLDIDLPADMPATLLTRADANILFDLRGNTGGSFLRLLPTLDALGTQWRGARIAVRVDRFTFSAAIVAAVLLKHHLGARIFGEDMGDGLRFWAEGDTDLLLATGAHLRWSDAWHDWETGQPDATTPNHIQKLMVGTGPLEIAPCSDGSLARGWVVP